MSETGRIAFPVLAVCGKAGSGRSSLMGELAAAMENDGISTALVFQQVGERSADKVERVSVAHLDTEQQSFEIKTTGTLQSAIRMLSATHDLLLVQGDETTPLPKLWLDDHDNPGEPTDNDLVLERFLPGASRLPSALALVRNWLMDAWLNRPVMVAIHRTTSTAETSDQTLLHHVALLTNLTNRDDTLLLEFPAGEDVPGGETLLRTLRSRPGSAWLLAGTDAELPDSTSMRALFEARRPGRWVLGFTPRAESPLPILLEPQAVAFLEDIEGDLAGLLDHRCFHSIEGPSSAGDE